MSDQDLSSGTANLTLDNINTLNADIDGGAPSRESKAKINDAASDSDLSEIDEELFQNYNHEETVANDRPVIAIDEEAIGKIGVHRRVRDPNAVNEQPVVRRKDKGRRRGDKRRRDPDEDEHEQTTHRERPMKQLTEEESMFGRISGLALDGRGCIMTMVLITYFGFYRENCGIGREDQRCGQGKG